MWRELRTKCSIPIGERERHFLPAILGAVSAVAPLFAGGGRRRPKPMAMAAPTAPPSPGGGGVVTRIVGRAIGGGLPRMGGRRRRRRHGLSSREIQTLMLLSTLLGKHSPAVNFFVMKHMGRL